MPQSQAQRDWYLRNRERQMQDVAEKRRRFFLRVQDIKALAGCARCPENDAVCLDFHHVGTKEFSIATGLRRGFAEKRVLAEIDKCIVLCANCHRKEHAQ